jgi:hypothetical protein
LAAAGDQGIAEGGKRNADQPVSEEPAADSIYGQSGDNFSRGIVAERQKAAGDVRKSVFEGLFPSREMIDEARFMGVDKRIPFRLLGRGQPLNGESRLLKQEWSLVKQSDLPVSGPDSGDRGFFVVYTRITKP